MSKVRVPIFGRLSNYVAIEANATVGATIGRDLFNADGTLFDLAAFTLQVAERQSAGTGVPTEGETVIYWTAIQSIPANVTQAANLAGEGFLRRSDAGAWSASAIVNADLADADTDGLAEGATNLYFTDGRVDARISASTPYNRIDATGDIRIGADGSLRATYGS